MKGSKIKSIAWVVIMLVFGISAFAIGQSLVVDQNVNVGSGSMLKVGSMTIGNDPSDGRFKIRWCAPWGTCYFTYLSIGLNNGTCLPDSRVGIGRSSVADVADLKLHVGGDLVEEFTYSWLHTSTAFVANDPLGGSVLIQGTAPSLVLCDQDGTHGYRSAGIFNSNQDLYIKTLYDDWSSWNTLFTFNHLGNLGIRTTTFGTNASGVLGIYNGTEPTSSPANMIQLYAKDYMDGDGTSTSELFVRDEDGNAVDLSPHIFALFKPDPSEPFPWAYYAENNYIGKRINVDMAGLVRAVEKLTGKQFIYYENIPKVDPVEGKREAWKQEWIAKNTREEEITKNEAFIFVNVEVEDMNETVGEQITYRLEGTDVVEDRKPVYAKSVVQKPKLKNNVRFDRKTGRFFMKVVPTDDEAEAAASSESNLTLRKRIRDRM